jgi:hypothetical protein
VPDGVWNHLVVTAEGPASDKRRTIYVNGTNYSFTLGGGGAQATNSNPLTIGNAWYWSKPGSEHFRGYLDDLRIYTRELADSEIQLLFHASE